jgi:hypothetical protein
VAGVSDDEVPDWFSAGEDRTAANPAVVKVLTKVRTFCSAQPSSFDTTTLKAFARRGDTARSKVAHRMIGLEEMVWILEIMTLGGDL